ncbi:MAG: hypothetical protein WC254_00110 [Candidatus Woesearchaeota archaeon]|jgi:hypothetical protein
MCRLQGNIATLLTDLPELDPSLFEQRQYTQESRPDIFMWLDNFRLIGPTTNPLPVVTTVLITDSDGTYQQYVLGKIGPDLVVGNPTSRLGSSYNAPYITGNPVIIKPNGTMFQWYPKDHRF